MATSTTIKSPARDIKNFKLEDITKEVYTYVSAGSSSLSSVKFGFLKLGDLCNASKPCSFSKANCDFRRITDENNIPRILDFETIFCRGIKLLKDVKNGKSKKDLTECELRALEILDTFFKNKDKDEECLRKVLQKTPRKKEKISETQLTLALSEHVFRKLAPGTSYSIDKMSKTSSGEESKCSCGSESWCESDDSVFGETVIGFKEGWHGFIDVMLHFDDDNGPSAADRDDDKDDKGSAGASSQERPDSKTASKIDEGDLKNSGGTAILEFKLSPTKKGVFDQAIAQTIVFSFTQRGSHPNLREIFIPNILVSPKELRVFMYDSDDDILIYSPPLDIFQDDTGVLNVYSIIVLWMVLHYKLFCEETKSLIANKDIDKDEAKANFREKNKYKSHAEFKANYFPPPMKNTLNSFKELSLGIPFK